MAKARKKPSSRDQIAAAVATLREHALVCCVVVYELDKYGNAGPHVYWGDQTESLVQCKRLFADAAMIYEKNPDAWG